ncbi:MAG: hypothetical protein AUK37_09605 [Rhodobacterales bacterium CG2_30_65_12]|nr:MAG: hypothetical protein AUK37_09605 [Rhodobacterales bacterium CG2_30_65_12]
MLKTETTQNTLTFTREPRGETIIAIAATVIFAGLAALFFARGTEAGVIFLVFAVSGPVYLYFFVETEAVAFDRAAGTVTFSHRGPRGRGQTVHPLAGLARAEVHRATPSRENRAVDAELAAAPSGKFRAVLLYEDGSEMALSEGYSASGAAFEEVRAVNRWLEQL